MIPSRGLQWLSLVAIIWLQTINGTNSNFPAYSNEFKTLLSLSEVQLNNLAFASDAGKLFGFLAGIAAVYLPLWLVLFIGSFLGLLGYGLQYLFLTHYIASLSYAQIFFLTVVAGNSICWINTVCYVVTIRNFPSARQVAVGLSTSYVGLSAKVYTDSVNALFSESPIKKAKGYLLLNSVLPLIVSVIAAPMIRSINTSSVDPKSSALRGGFIAMFAITIATGLYSVISSLKVMSSDVDSALCTGLFLLAPLAVPIGVTVKKVLDSRQSCVSIENKVYNVNVGHDSVSENRENLDHVVNFDGIEVIGAGAKEESCDCHIEEIGVKLMLKRLNFWLYFFVYLLGATIGLVYLNNLGQIAESRGLSTSSSLVSLSASFGFFGRLLPSLLEPIISRINAKKYSWISITGPGCIATMMAPISGAMLLLVVGKSRMVLYASTAIIGVCTGAITSISVSTTAELFGSKNFSVNHNVVVANIPIGSFAFGYMAALIYHSRQGIAQNGDEKCMGMQCYQTSFMVWASLCFVGTCLAIILHARTRNFYRHKL